MKKLPFLLFFLLSFNLYSQDEDKPLPLANQQEACETFKEVRKKIDSIKLSQERKKGGVIGLALTVATYNAVRNFDSIMSARDKAKIIKGFNDVKDPQVRKILRLPEQPLTTQQLSNLDKKSSKKMISEGFKGIKSILKLTGLATIAVIAIDYYHERSIAKVIRGFISDFSIKAGDTTMTAHYANDPKNFFELNSDEACRFLGSDKESKSAPLLRQITMEMNALLSGIKEEHQEENKGSDQSDRNIQIKSDLPSSGTNTKSETTGSNQQ